MSQIHFFATRDDLVPVFLEIEATRLLRYVPVGISESASVTTFETITELPRLGMATLPSSAQADRFLVCANDESVVPRRVGDRFFIDQLYNPRTVVFSPGGLFGHDVLLAGSIGSATNEEFSTQLLRQLRKAIRRRCQKIKAFYVGEEAAQMLDAGKRLTMSADSPRMLDLSRA